MMKLLFCLALLSGAYVVLTPASTRKAEVKRDHCNKTVDIYEDVSSPEVTAETFGKPMTCWYRFRSFRGTPRDWILRIRFKKFKVGTLVNATYCHLGYMQVVIHKKSGITEDKRTTAPLYNARQYAARLTKEIIEEPYWEFLEHMAFRPDLATTEFHIFGPLKNHLGGKRFTDGEEVEIEVRMWLRQQTKNFYSASLKALFKRWDRGINISDDCIEK